MIVILADHFFIEVLKLPNTLSLALGQLGIIFLDDDDIGELIPAPL